MLDGVLANIRMHGRIALCGMISQYKLERPGGVRNLSLLFLKRVRMEGFMVFDYLPLYLKFGTVLPAIQEGRIIYVEDTVRGLDNASAALIGRFCVRNIGKQLIAVAP